MAGGSGPADAALSETIPGLRPNWVDGLSREWRGEGESYWLTRFLILRLLGAIYLVAFVVLARQHAPLFGESGLTPVGPYLERVGAHFGAVEGVWRVPTLFWVGHSDATLAASAWLGVALSLVVVAGYANAVLMAAIWVLYLSFVHVGQQWYGYGWEIQLCETGFLAIFLCPLLDARPFPRRPPPTPVIWLFRWLIVRIMLGAGLIKLRGDACWRELTCLEWHYETQPIPNPLSRTLHFMPPWFHRVGLLYNHMVELVAPWFAFGPRRARHVAGLLMLSFQLLLIASGNLSFLNYLTIVPILACFDDSLLSRVLPRRLVRRAERARARAQPSVAQKRVVTGVFGVVALLSIFPVVNLLSSRQAMNRSYNPLAIANTYGAFGAVTRERREIVFEGTADEVLGPDTRWLAYELPCKPGDPERRPCIASPYHHRLDWQIWFAAMGDVEQSPWTRRFARRLLEGDPALGRLLATNPFPNAPPRWIRAELYRYEFAPPGNPSGAWWRREKLGTWLAPITAAATAGPPGSRPRDPPAR